MADWDENSPSDSDFIAQFPANERAARAALVANFGVDHEANDEDANIGKHVKVSLVDQSSDPAGAANSSTLYAKGVSGASQLFWRSDTGAVVQLTAAGGLRAESLVGTIADARLPDNVPLKGASNIFTIGQQISATTPYLRLIETDAAADNKIWNIRAAGGTMQFELRSDDDGTISRFLTVNRTGTNIDSLVFVGDTITFNGVNVADYARKSAPNTFTADNTFGGEVWLSSGTPRVWLQETDAGQDNGLWHIQASGGVLSIGARTDAFAADNVFSATRSGGTVGTVTIGGDVRASRIATSTSTTLAAGQIHVVTGNSTLPNMTTGQWVGVINNSNSPITVTKNASDTMYWTASGASVTSVTVAARGKATFFCADGTNVYASGNITGAS